MTLRSYYRRGRKFQRLLETEWSTRETYERSLRRRIWLWRRGFLSRSDYLYDLDDNAHERYLSDFARSVRTTQINGEWSIALGNKLISHWLLAEFDEHRMDVFGMVRDGEYLTVGASDTDRPFADGASLESSNEHSPATKAVRAHLDEHGRVVLKWTKGGGGENVYICSVEGGTYHVNGEPKSRAEFDAFVSTLDEYLVCEFVEQNAFGRSLYPETTNTLRILTMYDDAGEPFVPIAIYRMGTDRSAPMDNFSKGGLNAEIDVETGTLGRAVQLPRSTELVWHTEHPDTGAQIAGVEMPGWETIYERILEIAAANEHVPYVGWDVVPTDETGGFTIIEGNSYPGTKSLQVHRPLLNDERVRTFYARHGVIPPE